MTPVTFDRAPTEEDLVPHVLEAIEEQTGVDPRTTTPSLHETVNTDALCELFAATPSGRDRAGGQVTFSYQDCTVIIDFDIHDGKTWIRITDVNA